MKPWMQTLRLDLREFTRDDFDDLLRLDSDPRVMKYINGGKPSSKKDVEAALGRVARYYRSWHGLGVWHAVRRDTGAFIGWYCLKYCPPTCDVEVGYRLLRQAWGQGFATEAVSAVIDYAFTTLNLHRISAVVDCENTPSVALLERIGMRREGHFIQNILFKGKYSDEYWYAILAEEWRRKYHAS